jgi:hypothetical protein
MGKSKGKQIGRGDAVATRTASGTLPGDAGVRRARSAELADRPSRSGQARRRAVPVVPAAVAAVALAGPQLVLHGMPLRAPGRCDVRTRVERDSPPSTCMYPGEDDCSGPVSYIQIYGRETASYYRHRPDILVRWTCTDCVGLVS